MKNLRILLPAFAVLATACMEKNEPDINRGVDIAALEATTDFEVPVREGYTTVVKLDSETIATARRPMTIVVPSDAVTRAGRIEVSYSNEAVFGEFALSTYWQYISFEDTRNGDYDYNDVVIHCRIKSDVPWNYTGKEYCKHQVSVQPVALGGTHKVGLGILYKDDAGAIREQILCEDIRRDLFNGDPTFPINTDRTLPTRKVTNYLTDLFECQTRSSEFRVVWFLISGGDRLYAATTNFGSNERLNMISTDGCPFGLVLTTKWCYPVERCNIRKAYPGFDTWLRTGNEQVLLAAPVTANTFPATVKSGSDGDLWDWQKRP